MDIIKGVIVSLSTRNPGNRKNPTQKAINVQSAPVSWRHRDMNIDQWHATNQVAISGISYKPHNKNEYLQCLGILYKQITGIRWL